MIFMSMQGHFWSKSKFSCFLAIYLHNFQKKSSSSFELIKDKATLKLQYSLTSYHVIFKYTYFSALEVS
jgi:hypothetical protein